MNTYYEILGLEPGASQVEIKKAYFKLIRQHSPESDPEQFQRIREAYEQLKNADGESQGPVFAPFQEPFAAKMMEQINDARRSGNSILYRDIAQEAWKLFPEEIQFLYHLIIAQRQCGNTGKAVKNAELLVDKDPKNKWFQRELAVSYIERGFTQKAYWACETAYELGCRDLDFVLMYASECGSYGEIDQGSKILWEVVDQEKRWTRDEIPELMEAYYTLLEFNYKYGERGKSLKEIIEKLSHMVEQYGLYLEEHLPAILVMMKVFSRLYLHGTEDYQAFLELIQMLRKSVHIGQFKEPLDFLEVEFRFGKIKSDPRYSETIGFLYDACYCMEDQDPQIRKFAILDCRLCMIEEREEIFRQAEMLQKEYPAFYERIRDYLEEMKEEANLPRLKEKLSRTYRNLEPDMDGGVYYKKYPQEKPVVRVIHDGTNEQPYVRAGKKIGRNDPCPCGSGKKYKNCCMNKK